MCFAAPKKMSAEQTKELNSRSRDDDSSVNASRMSVEGGTKSAPSRSSRPMARGERPSLVSRAISSLSQSISPKG